MTESRAAALEMVAVLRPKDPTDLAWEEDLTDEANERLIAAIEAAGFEVVDHRFRSVG